MTNGVGRLATSDKREESAGAPREDWGGPSHTSLGWLANSANTMKGDARGKEACQFRLRPPLCGGRAGKQGRQTSPALLPPRHSDSDGADTVDGQAKRTKEQDRRNRKRWERHTAGDLIQRPAPCAVKSSRAYRAGRGPCRSSGRCHGGWRGGARTSASARRVPRGAGPRSNSRRADRRRRFLASPRRRPSVAFSAARATGTRTSRGCRSPPRRRAAARARARPSSSTRPPTPAACGAARSA